MWRRRRLRIVLIVLIAASPLLAGGWLWLRGSSLVAVHHVQVSGAHGSQAHAIDEALTVAARHMTTLEVNGAALRAAVAPFRTVRDVRVSTSFPHGLRIRVIEQPPVAALTLGAQRTAVAADGVILGPALLSSSLPTLPASAQSSDAKRVSGASLLAALGVLGAAPAPLLKLIGSTYTSSKGLTVAMHGGLLVYFGDGSRPHAKWLSLASVLAAPSSAGASYVDVRVPERPAAGFASGSAPSSTSASAAAEPPSADSTEAIAARLSEASGSGSSTSPSETEAEPDSGGKSEASATSEAAESSQAPTEAPAAGG